MRHLLEIDDLSAAELRQLLDLAGSDPTGLDAPYAGQGVACVFEKPSARTRNSTEMAVVQLGGHPVYITDAEVGIDTRESAEDVARTLACYHGVLCARVFDHGVLDRMAAVDLIPVVNLLSDQAHPLQAVADILTIEAELGAVEGRTVTYVGDANNVTRSLALAIGTLGGHMRIVTPSGYGFGDADRARLASAGVDVAYHDDPAEALPGSDVVYTDTWVSMGMEVEREERLRAFADYRVDDAMLALAGDGAIFLHCLPAHRGEEVTSEVLDGERSRIWPQAANRLNAARGALAWLARQRA